MVKISKILILVFVIGGLLGFNLAGQIFQGTAQEELPLLVKEEKAPKPPRPLYVPDEIIVKFKPGIAKGLIEKLLTEQGALERYESKFAKFKVLKIPKGKAILRLVEIFKTSPLVEYAEPNYYAYATMVPNDPGYYLQWHFDNATYGGIQMEEAWDINTGSPSVIVAVVDTGVAYEDYPTDKYWHLDTYNAYSGYSWWCGVMENPNWAAPPGYSNYWEQYLIHEFNLSSATGNVTLFFKHKYDMERNYDFGYLEVSDDNGQTWTKLKEYTNKQGPLGGNPVNWTQDSIDLTSYKGENILIRFRFNSDYAYSDGDGYYNSDGAWYIDEVKITDDSGTLFDDNMESGVGSWQVDSLPFQKAPDLANTNFVAGYDFIDNDSHPNDDDSHGTHLAGTIAQSTNNNLGVAGIAFNTTVMPVKVLGPAGGTYQQVADGIYYAVNNGAKVINLSLGGPEPSTTLEDAVAYAYNNGVTVVAGCGNDNASSCDYPALYDNYVVAVGATQYDENKVPYSNYGTGLDLVAPGGNTGVDQNNDGQPDGVLQQAFGNTLQDWGYYWYQGTSMSTPHVSGVAALLLAQDSTRTPDDIRNILQTTAEDKGTTGWDQYYGWGIVDAYAALTYVPGVSITLTTDGSVDFGILPLNTTQDTTSSGINDKETVRIDIGPANLDIKSTIFSDNGNTWSLGSTNGANQVKWEFSPDTSTWNTFSSANTLYDLANNAAEGNTQDLYLRLTMPTSIDSSAEYSSTITIVATSP